MDMPGMSLPMPAKKAPATKTHKKPAAKKAAKKPVAKKAVTKAPVQRKHPTPSRPMTMPMHHGSMPMADHSQMDNGTMPQQPSTEPMQMPMDHSQMDHGAMPGMAMPTSERAGHAMAMTGALGAYPMERESSGTAWQPDSSEHAGLHVVSGDWMLMAHGVLNLVYDHQSGPRGDDQAFASGMLMGMARRSLGNGALQFKAMVSPDP